jgi:hypothetical protein
MGGVEIVYPLIFAGKRKGCRLGSVMVSMLAIRPKVGRFNIEGNRFLRAIKIHSTSSFGEEVKLETPCCKILWHVKITTSMNKVLHKAKFIIPFAHPPACYQMSLLVGLPESSGR